MDDDRHYHACRAATERQRAAIAVHPAVRRVHLELAQRYEALLAAPPPPVVVSAVVAATA